MSCDCGCTIVMWTPESILKCVTHSDDDPTPVDCFEDAVPAGTHHEAMVQALWSTYRYAMISSTCLDRWLQRLKDTAQLVQRRYSILLDAWDSADKSGIKRGWQEDYEDHGTATGSGADTVQTRTEDIPQTEGATESEWLSSRVTTDTTPGATRKTDANGSRKHTDNYQLPAEALKAVGDNLEDPLIAYAREFSDLFLARWSMGGCCGCRREPSTSTGWRACRSPMAPIR